MKQEEFEALIEEIGRGADVDQEELAEALGYAGSLWYKIQQLTKKLCSGYRALQVDCARKDQKIEVTNRLLTAAKAENKRLREELEELRAGAVAHTVSRCSKERAEGMAHTESACSANRPAACCGSSRTATPEATLQLRSSNRRCSGENAWSEGACLGYAVMGLRGAGFNPCEAVQVLEAMGEAMRIYTLEQAAEAHQALLEDRETEEEP